MMDLSDKINKETSINNPEIDVASRTEHNTSSITAQQNQSPLLNEVEVNQEILKNNR